jgi:DNA-binding GntR family transcriptional regulator
MESHERRIRSVRQSLLSELVYEHLLGDIIGGRYQPGQRLHLDALADEFVISRTPVREALQRLTSLKFVDISRNARTTVAEWSVDDMRERAQVIGKVTAFAALAPNAGMRLDVSRFRPKTDASDVQRYLELAALLMHAQFTRVADYIERDLVDPLQKFVQISVLQRHRLDLEANRTQREALLEAALASYERNDSLSASCALDDYAAVFAAALTLPAATVGPGHGNHHTHPDRPTPQRVGKRLLPLGGGFRPN